MGGGVVSGLPPSWLSFWSKSFVVFSFPTFISGLWGRGVLCLSHSLCTFLISWKHFLKSIIFATRMECAVYHQPWDFTLCPTGHFAYFLLVMNWRAFQNLEGRKNWHLEHTHTHTHTCPYVCHHPPVWIVYIERSRPERETGPHVWNVEMCGRVGCLDIGLALQIYRRLQIWDESICQQAFLNYEETN